MRDLYLSIDVGTGGIRSALVDRDGRIVAFAHQEHEQIVPQFGWSEQRPADWWAGTVATLKAVLSKVDNASARVAAICACGQMHGSVLIDDDGVPTLDAVPLWNDKRSNPQVEAFAARVPHDQSLGLAANLPSPAWPAFKLAWIAENRPDALARSSALLMPKDWINFKLTGRRAQDITEASLSFLMDWRTREWSDELCELTGVSRGLLCDLLRPEEILGPLLPQVAEQTGLPAGLPVLVGAGDYPMALIGSGVIAPGMGSDVTGTSTIVTLMHDEPVLSAGISNVISANGDWGSMTLLDAGGDAVRWARRAFHDNERSYAQVAEDAAGADVGSKGMFFLPYLSGERFGMHRNSRAQFFGISASHGLPEMHRSVLEGVAFSVRHKLDMLQGGHGRPDRIVAAGGGARNHLWLQIKASMYNVPYLVPEELECGVVGSAMLMATATGAADSLEGAAKTMVRFTQDVPPNPRWAEVYDRMMPLYERLYLTSQSFYDELDQLA
ncbi:FGGY family carbohydrate kinase [uncultured Aliiroseovarius sp.]|uniref:xylulokinase n=1 Tax=uncultured Aliiroseovarius sp. TaxID=1658783 RepID=UPI0025921445|nr:FGGY family carbohydrate kinase [uncultured Aliiroseovarius sp.]